MGYVSDLLALKGGRVLTISPDASVYEATAKMNQYKLGALVVVGRENPRRMVGIFTERDVLRRIVAQLRYPDLVSVGEVMTADVVTVTPDTTIDEASAIMQDRRVRHLPVLNEQEELAGVISIGDLNAWHVVQQKAQIEHLNDYICGRT